MAIKNILVVVNQSTGSADAVQAALQMQQKYDAHLTGILVHYGTRERFADDNWVPDNVRAILEGRVHDREALVEEGFREIAAGIVPPEKLHWLALSGQPDDTLAKYVAMYDVAVMGRNAARDDTATDLHPERVALMGGRPILVVPTPFDPESLNKRAVVAFDGRRAASRVIHDAMLYLETKSQVDIVSSGDRMFKPENSIGAVDLLARHGVKADRVRLSGGSKAFGEQVLEYCGAVDAGVLFMGVYEKGIFREEFFGGATRHVLEHASLPVMISH
jgi:nucleotide-binding universal stress UspA family protein